MKEFKSVKAYQYDGKLYKTIEELQKAMITKTLLATKKKN